MKLVIATSGLVLQFNYIIFIFNMFLLCIMTYKKLSYIVFFLFSQCLMFGQNTVGVFNHIPSKTSEGYLLLFPDHQSNVFLINNCGEVVHQWEFEENIRSGTVCYLTKDGNLVSSVRDKVIDNDPIWSGGASDKIIVKDWDNNILF